MVSQKQLLREKRLVTFFIALAVLIELSVWLTRLGSFETTLFFLALLIYQGRFLYLIWWQKPNQLTFQAASSQKKPLVLDYVLNSLFFVIFPLGYTWLHLTFYTQWRLGGATQMIFFGLYLIGTSITLIAEHQRKVFKKQHPDENFRLHGLFKYAIGINYFGEVLALPSLFYLSTGSVLIFGLMLVQQIADFSFVQMPKQISYIKEKYPDEVDEILKQKKLIPFIY